MANVVRLSDSKFSAYLEGGPELARRLDAMDADIAERAVVDALRAGGRIIADTWSAMAPVGTPPEDEHPGAYQRALAAPEAVNVAPIVGGASGAVSPAWLGELADDQQPRVYAAVLEFGDETREPEPSARPAFDAALDPALAAITRTLAGAVE